MRFVSLVLHIYFLHMGEQIESWKPSWILEHILTHRYIAAAAASFDGRITLLCEFYIQILVYLWHLVLKNTYIFFSTKCSCQGWNDCDAGYRHCKNKLYTWCLLNTNIIENMIFFMNLLFTEHFLLLFHNLGSCLSSGLIFFMIFSVCTWGKLQVYAAVWRERDFKAFLAMCLLGTWAAIVWQQIVTPALWYMDPLFCF